MEIEEAVIGRGRRPRRITSYKTFIILYMIRKSNQIIVLLFIRNNSLFKNIAKTCLALSMLSSSSIHSYCTFRVVQLRKYSPNSRCRPSSCLLAVLAIVLGII